MARRGSASAGSSASSTCGSGVVRVKRRRGGAGQAAAGWEACKVSTGEEGREGVRSKNQENDAGDKGSAFACLRAAVYGCSSAARGEVKVSTCGRALRSSSPSLSLPVSPFRPTPARAAATLRARRGRRDAWRGRRARPGRGMHATQASWQLRGEAGRGKTRVGCWAHRWWW